PIGGDGATADGAAPAGAASAYGCAGRAARATGPADRSTLRPPPGHRMEPRRRRFSHFPEPANHNVVSYARGDRPREPRLHLGRASADDDRPHEAPGTVRVAADDP